METAYDEGGKRHWGKTIKENYLYLYMWDIHPKAQSIHERKGEGSCEMKKDRILLWWRGSWETHSWLIRHQNALTVERIRSRRTHQEWRASDTHSALQFYVTLNLYGSFPAKKIHSQNMLKLFTSFLPPLFLFLLLFPERETVLQINIHLKNTKR